ncbi:MAG TPA: flagellar protein FlaG [Herbaspirillum sp.]|nr:flagellar protein FlaG [Herbaspirillum sp.]
MSISALPPDIAVAGNSGFSRPMQPIYYPPTVSTLPWPPPVVGTLPLFPPSENDIASTVEELNKFISQSTPSITFSQDDDSGKTIIKVIDTTDNTVLRQIPSQEALHIAKSLDKLQGWLINKKA